MDPKLGDSCIDDQLLRCIHVSLLCVEANAADRPSMSEVISMLANESMPPTPTRPSFFGGTQEDESDISGKESEILSIGLSPSDVVGR